MKADPKNTAWSILFGGILAEQRKHGISAAEYIKLFERERSRAIMLDGEFHYSPKDWPAQATETLRGQLAANTGT